jgi:hypothetical protein
VLLVLVKVRDITVEHELDVLVPDLFDRCNCDPMLEQERVELAVVVR